MKAQPSNFGGGGKVVEIGRMGCQAGGRVIRKVDKGEREGSGAPILGRHN